MWNWTRKKCNKNKYSVENDATRDLSLLYIYRFKNGTWNEVVGCQSLMKNCNNAIFFNNLCSFEKWKCKWHFWRSQQKSADRFFFLAWIQNGKALDFFLIFFFIQFNLNNVTRHFPSPNLFSWVELYTITRWNEDGKVPVSNFIGKKNVHIQLV